MAGANKNVGCGGCFAWIARARPGALNGERCTTDDVVVDHLLKACRPQTLYGTGRGAASLQQQPTLHPEKFT